MDIDIQGGVHKEKDLPTKEQALAFLNEIPFKPSIIVWSGGGYQPYWLFKEPWSFDNKEERQKAKRLSERFQLTILPRLKSMVGS